MNALLDLPLQLEIRTEREKATFSTQCPTKFLLTYVTYGKGSFEIVLTPP